LLLHGVRDVPAEKMLGVAEQVRQAVATIGIDDVRVEVDGEEDPATDHTSTMAVPSRA
jgi:UDP-3-O-acyl-N-acetylglucosamine deacetylase